MMTDAPKTVLLLGNLRASLTLARTLSRDGLTVVAGLDQPDPYLFLSRHVQAVLPHAPLDAAPEAALARVEQALDAYSIDAVVPVSEVATRLVAEHHERLSRRTRLAMPAPDLVKRCADKAGLFDACDAAEVPIARRLVVSTVRGLHAAAHRMNGPLIVKPTDSTRYIAGRKAVIAPDPKALVAALQNWPEGHRTLCVQQLVDGPRLNVYFAARQGQLIGAVAVRIDRTDTLDGTGYAVAGRSIAAAPALRGATERLLAHLTYDGVGCAQFMSTPDGETLSFLEINPRLGANYKIADACGLDLSRMALALPLGLPVEAPADPWRYRTGVRYAWTKGALSGVVKARRTHGLGIGATAGLLARTAWEATARCHLTFDLRDPAPTLANYANKWIERRFTPDADARAPVRLAGVSRRPA